MGRCQPSTVLRDQEQLASIALYGLSARRQCGRLVNALEVGVLRPLQPPDLAAAGGTVGPLVRQPVDSPSAPCFVTPAANVS